MRTPSMLLQLLFTTLLCVFSLGAAAFAQESRSAPIKIGVIIPLTGPIADSAQSFRAAALMALEDAGKNTKLSYRLVFEDDQLQSKNAATAAMKLITQDRVSAILSTWSYGGSVVSPITERAKVIHISNAWAHDIALGDFNFLSLTPPRAFVPVLLEIFKQRGFKSLATFVVAEAGSVYSVKELERLSPEYGIKITSKVEVGFSDSDFRSVITKELAKKPDVLYVNMVSSQLDAFMTQLRSFHANIPVVVQTGLSTVSSLAPYEGYWFAADSYFPDSALEERLVRITGNKNTLYAANFYDSVQMLIQAFEQCAASTQIQPNNSEVLRCTQGLKTTQSIFTNSSMDAQGVLSYEPRLYTVKDGNALPTTTQEILNSSWGR